MTKEDLREYRHISNELYILDCEREKWLSRAERSTRAPSRAPALGGAHDPMPLIMDRLDEIRAASERQYARLHAARKRIERVIEALPSVERRLMRLRYIDGADWLTVSEKMAISEVWAYKLHNRALKRINAVDNFVEKSIEQYS